MRRPGAPTTAGTLVDDYANSLIPARALGRDWAAPHRWAVALDIGTLVFVDDADLVDTDVDGGGAGPGQPTSQ